MNGLSANIDRLGQYEIVREVGSGAMGAVYLGQDGPERVALKVIHAHLAREPRFFKRFEREAEAGSRVRHPNVVRTLLHGTSAAEGQPICYLVMEFVEGRTLRSLLSELGTVPEALLREIALQTTAGLAAIHEAGIVHRDLKPENVLITHDDRIRIMDLGVARIAGATSVLTRDGEFSGSLPYAAPEQFKDVRAGPATDLYALGVVLYELATGHNPFRLNALPAVIHAHLESTPPRATDRNSELSPFLSEVIACLLAKQPEERFASARVLYEVLEAGESAPWWTSRSREGREDERDRPVVPVRRETRLHGRGTELAALDRCWQRAQAGEGCVILLEGEAGIGKSRLVDAFLRSVGSGDAHLLYGSYAPAGGLGAVSDAILAKLGSDELEDALRPYTRSMPGLTAAFARSIRQDTPAGGAPVPHDALHAVLVEFMRGLAAERPVLWVVEDLHFADASAHQRALSMARGVVGHPVCLLLTSRPGYPESDLAHLSRLEEFRRLPLGRLGAREVILLLQDAFQSEVLADRLGARIALKSDGVPFFAFEVIRDLREKEFIKELPGGRWIESRPIKEIDVPSAVRDLIEARVSGLEKDDRAILDVGAVQGFEFSPLRTAGVLDRRVVGVLQDLAEIERRVGVVRAIGRSYRFDHHQIQEVLYAQLPPRLREEYHAVLADEIAREAGPEPTDAVCAELCRHFVAGARERDAVPWLERALDHLQFAYRHEEVVRLGRRILAVPGCLEGAARVEVLLRLAETLHLLGDPAGERELLQEARTVAEQTGEFTLQSRAQSGLGRYLERTAEFVAATEVLDRAIEAAREAGSLRLEIEALAGLGRVCYGRGAFAEARAHYERQRDLARELEDPRLEASAIGALGTALSRLGHYEEAVDCFRRYLDGIQGGHDLYAESAARGNLGVELSHLGRYDEAREQLEQQLTISAEIGHRYGEARASGNLGAVALYRDDAEQARIHYERELAIMGEIGDRRGAALATGNLGIVHSRQGRPAEARACFQTWLDESRTIGNRAGEAGAHGQLGFLCMTEGDLGRAREHFESWQQISKETGDLSAEASATAYLGDVLLKEGRFAEARTCYARRFAVCREIGDRRGHAHAHLNLGVVARALGRWAAAQNHLRRSLEIAREIGEESTVGRARLELGTLARMQGRYEEALEHAEAYASIARDVSARSAEATAAGVLARVHMEAGRFEEARAQLGRHLAISREQESRLMVAETQVLLATLESETGAAEEAAVRLDEAARLAAELDDVELRVRVACHRAALCGVDVDTACEDLARWEERLEERDRMEAHYLLWRATGDAEHLATASHVLEALIAGAPEEGRPGMAERVRLYRAIREAVSRS